MPFSFAFAVAVACGGATSSLDGGPDSGAGEGSVPADTFTCNAPGECDIRPVSCCGQCGAPTPADMIGVNWQRGSAYTNTFCSGVGCPACFKEPDPNLAPVCRASSCKAIDVRVDDALSKCNTDPDCRLRFAGCCEFCNMGNAMQLIALSTSGAQEYGANQCHPDQGGCPKCAVMYPPGYAARCNPTTRHCEVVSGILDAGAD